MKVFVIFEEFPFLTLSNKVEKCLCIRSVQALTLVNIYQISWNLNMLLMSNVAWTVLKLVWVLKSDSRFVYRDTQSFLIHYAYGGEEIPGFPPSHFVTFFFHWSLFSLISHFLSLFFSKNAYFVILKISNNMPNYLLTLSFCRASMRSTN